jgi:hypothetical protein
VASHHASCMASCNVSTLRRQRWRAEVSGQSDALGQVNYRRHCPELIGRGLACRASPCRSAVACMASFDVNTLRVWRT